MSKFCTFLSLFLGFTLFCEQSFSQQFCATPSPTLAQEKANQLFINQLRSGSTNGRSNAFIGTQYIPIRFHILTQSDGTGTIPLTELNKALAIANAYYSNANIQFYMVGTAPHLIANSTFYNYNFSQENALCTPNDADNAVNVYLTNTIIFNSINVTGYAYFPSQDKTSNRVFLQNNGSLIKTFMHEMGHYFNLYHTFQNNQDADISKRELATRGAGANCSTTGDLLCDTPADPYGIVGANVANCIYNGSVIDAQGSPFTPSITNIMSYYPEVCGNSFTADQYNRIAGGLLLRLVPYFDPSLRYSLDAPSSVVTKPSALSASLGASGVSLSWTDNSNNETGFIIERSPLSATEGFLGIGGVAPNATTFRDSLISSGETYYYRLKPSNTNTSYSNVVAATVGLRYCKPTYSLSCDLGEFIDDFILKKTTLSRILTGCSTNNYGDYTSVPVNVKADSVYQFTANAITGGDINASFVEQHLSIWIDADHDGTFSVAERVYQSTNAQTMNPTINATIHIPANCLPGLTRMRVRSREVSEGLVADPCAKYILGETEDYTLNVLTNYPTIATGTPSAEGICPNQVFTVPFTTTGSFGVGNTFKVQMSDDKGKNFTDIASTGNVSPLSVTMPAGFKPSKYYKVRVVASNPSVIGTPNSNTLAIRITPTANLAGDVSIVAGQLAHLCVAFTGGPPYNLNMSGVSPISNITENPYFVTINPIQNGTFNLSSVDSPCGIGVATGSATVTLTNPNLSCPPSPQTVGYSSVVLKKK